MPRIWYAMHHVTTFLTQNITQIMHEVLLLFILFRLHYHLVESCYIIIFNLQGCFTTNGANMWLLWCQWSKLWRVWVQLSSEKQHYNTIQRDVKHMMLQTMIANAFQIHETIRIFSFQYCLYWTYILEYMPFTRIRSRSWNIEMCMMIWFMATVVAALRKAWGNIVISCFKSRTVIDSVALFESDHLFCNFGASLSPQICNNQ